MPVIHGGYNTAVFEHRDTRELADRELKARRDMYDMNARYYRGEVAPNITDKQDQMILPLIKQGLDRLIQFSFGRMPGFQLDNDADTNDDEAWLRAFWEFNGGVTRIQNVVLNGALSGHAFIRIVRDDRAEFPMLVNLSPRNMLVWYDADDMERVTAYEMRWEFQLPAGSRASERETRNKPERVQMRQDIIPIYADMLQDPELALPDGMTRADLPRNSVVRWEVLEFTLDRNGRDWALGNEAELWNMPLPPLVDIPHLPTVSDYYGASEVSPVVRNLYNQVNRIASDVKKILRFHAGPMVFATKTGNVKDQAPLDIEPGKIIEYSKDVSVTMLELQGDLPAARAFLSDTSTQLFREMSVIMPPVDLDTFRGVTNLGLRTTYMPMIGKAKILQKQYGELISQISQTALGLSGRASDIAPTLSWDDALPVDERETVALLQQELNMGIISPQMAMRERHRDPDTVSREISEWAIELAIGISGEPFGVSG